ncbi:protein bfr2-like [Cornus florida]|uniref:protein bfr2-like n=1 Tax=Cornus florida TaxID=4283 RepID=UPI00289ECD5A|nr:protein bfr2-like [Cornus florida]
MKDPKLSGDWHVVQKVIPRNWYDVPELSLQHEDEDIDEDNTYETEDEEDVDLVVYYNEQDVNPLHMEDVEPEYVDPIVDPTHNAEVDQLDDEFVIDDDDTSEDDTLIDYCDDWEDEDEDKEEEEEILCTDNDTDAKEALCTVPVRSLRFLSQSLSSTSVYLIRSDPLWTRARFATSLAGGVDGSTARHEISATEELAAKTNSMIVNSFQKISLLVLPRRESYAGFSAPPGL